MTHAPAPYPHCRPRRLRQQPWTRRLVHETTLTVDDLRLLLGQGEIHERASRGGF